MRQTRKNLNYREYESPDSLVYVVKGHRYYKIGSSTHLKKRLTELQIGSEYPLTVIVTIHTPTPRLLEKELHKRFSEKRVRGEWFQLTDEDVTFLKRQNQEEITVPLETFSSTLQEYLSHLAL